MKLEYSSNNSGGSWWLSDKDWLALEAAGWVIDWYDADEEYDYPGARKGIKRYPGGRFLDALASRAHKVVSSKAEGLEAIDEWERVTGKSSTSEGCNCCGRPHYFSLSEEEDCGYCDEGDSVCNYCEGTGIYDRHVASLDVSPKYIEYNRSWD